MKLMHISDLHLGKKIGNFSMLENQEDILNKIFDIISSEKPNALLISGDVYNKPIPSSDAVTMFDDFIFRLSSINGLETFIISGNHDSSERLAFGERIFSQAGIHISPVYSGNVEPAVLHDEYGDVAIYMLPYVRATQIKHFFADNVIENYTDAVSCAVNQLGIDRKIRNVLLSHQTVIGALRCETEMNIGGLDEVSPDVYSGFDYVALGHIHRPQNVRENCIRYCGAPLKYAFDECNQQKSVTIVDLGEKGCVNVSTVPLIPKFDFVRIEGLFNDICEEYRGKTVNDYVEIILNDETDVSDAFSRLKNYFPRLMKMHYNNTRTREKKITAAARNVQLKTAAEIFGSFFEMMNNQPMSNKQAEYMDNIIREIEDEQL